jgi:hypothetical protein
MKSDKIIIVAIFQNIISYKFNYKSKRKINEYKILLKYEIKYLIIYL